MIQLANKAHKLTNGKHNSKTQSFVKACIAYSHITIPTLENTDQQLKLFLLTAQSSLLNGLIGETDSLIKAVLATMDENFSTNMQKFDGFGNKVEISSPDRLQNLG